MSFAVSFSALKFDQIVKRHMGSGTGPGPVLTGLWPVLKLGPVRRTVQTLLPSNPSCPIFKPRKRGTCVPAAERGRLRARPPQREARGRQGKRENGKGEKSRWSFEPSLILPHRTTPSNIASSRCFGTQNWRFYLLLAMIWCKNGENPGRKWITQNTRRCVLFCFTGTRKYAAWIFRKDMKLNNRRQYIGKLNNENIFYN